MKFKPDITILSDPNDISPQFSSQMSKKANTTTNKSHQSRQELQMAARVDAEKLAQSPDNRNSNNFTLRPSQGQKSTKSPSQATEAHKSYLDAQLSNQRPNDQSEYGLDQNEISSMQMSQLMIQERQTSSSLFKNAMSNNYGRKTRKDRKQQRQDGTIAV